jgi:acyl-coenzyme A synthetase/AMP-(fatty) acid ligase
VRIQSLTRGSFNLLGFIRYLETYMHPYKGYYFTGDGAGRDKDGYYWIKGRVDGQSLVFQLI